MKQTALGNRYALSALTHKRAQLAGELRSLENQAKWKRQQLEAVDATLSVFGHADPAAIKPVKAYQRIHLFKQGELCRLVREALRESGKPMSAAAVAMAVTKKLGHGESAYPAMRKRIDSSLAYLWRERREVLKAGHYTGVRWRLR